MGFPPATARAVATPRPFKAAAISRSRAGIGRNWTARGLSQSFVAPPSTSIREPGLNSCQPLVNGVDGGRVIRGLLHTIGSITGPTPTAPGRCRSAPTTYAGGTTISAGTLQIGNGGTTGSIVGNVTDSGTLAFDRVVGDTLGRVDIEFTSF